MKAHLLFTSRRLRELLGDKPRSPQEKAEQIDQLRALVPVSAFVGIASLVLVAVELYRGPDHWIEYVVIFAFTGMAIQNGYAFIKARKILHEN